MGGPLATPGGPFGLSNHQSKTSFIDAHAALVTRALNGSLALRRMWAVVLCESRDQGCNRTHEQDDNQRDEWIGCLTVNPGITPALHTDRDQRCRRSRPQVQCRPRVVRQNSQAAVPMISESISPPNDRLMTHRTQQEGAIRAGRTLGYGDLAPVIRSNYRYLAFRTTSKSEAPTALLEGTEADAMGFTIQLFGIGAKRRLCLISERPDTDPYVRWCGRVQSVARLTPIPIRCGAKPRRGCDKPSLAILPFACVPAEVHCERVSDRPPCRTGVGGISVTDDYNISRWLGAPRERRPARTAGQAGAVVHTDT